MKVMLWLSITQGSEDEWMARVHSFDQLWYREVDTGCVPVPGQDAIYLYPGEDGDDTDGPRVQTRRRFMGASGQWHVELARVVVDPSERQRDYISSRLREGADSEFDVWWTASEEGPPDSGRLLAAGWVQQ